LVLLLFSEPLSSCTQFISHIILNVEQPFVSLWVILQVFLQLERMFKLDETILFLWAHLREYRVRKDEGSSRGF
jgi:hypothetical protein